MSANPVSSMIVSCHINRARIELGAGMKGAARQSLEALARLGDSFPQQAEVAALRRQVEQP